MCRLIYTAFIAWIIAQVSSGPSSIECPLARRYNDELKAPITLELTSEETREEAPAKNRRESGLSEDSDKLEAVVKSEEESEAESLINKGKREVCEQLLEQIQNLPCDNPVVVTCGNNLPKPYYPCSDRESSRENSDPEDLPADSVYPLDSSAPLPPPPPQSGVSQKDKGLFEGLLRLIFKVTDVYVDNSGELPPGPDNRPGFATVVNHIDTFISEKGKGFIRGLNRMVESEENASF